MELFTSPICVVSLLSKPFHLVNLVLHFTLVNQKKHIENPVYIVYFNVKNKLNFVILSFLYFHYNITKSVQ